METALYAVKLKRKSKQWFLTVDWCSRGSRGVFCDTEGYAFSKNTQHTEDEMREILDVFFIVLSPKSIELSEDELMEYSQFIPLAEYSRRFGVAVKTRDEALTI